MSIKNINSEKENINNYQNTCSEFIKDLSLDYLNWVDRYNLTPEEMKMRKQKINDTVIKSSHIIDKFGDTIKKIDIIMNDGISKMAEYTAGYPFQFSILVNNLTRYTYNPGGKIRLNIKAIPNYGKGVRIGSYDKSNLILLNSSSSVNYSFNKSSLESADILDDYIIIDAKNCLNNDIISVTVIVEEIKDNIVFEKRGFSTLILVIQKN
ncbi:MAG TPA: hypothetical protein VE307_06950 [Nitrososphaeraceae archaeon]|jgi:hypothetical protein|nr:hypothetical protein [Nitrososphaeraceae archaeon]